MGETSSLVYSCSTNTFTKLQLCLQIGRNNKLLSRKPQAFTKANCSVLYRKYFPSELWTHYSIFATPLSVHGILQSRIPEWVAIPFSRGSSRPRDRNHVSWVSCIGRQILYHWATREALPVTLAVGIRILPWYNAATSALALQNDSPC